MKFICKETVKYEDMNSKKWEGRKWESLFQEHLIPLLGFIKRDFRAFIDKTMAWEFILSGTLPALSKQLCSFLSRAEKLFNDIIYSIFIFHFPCLLVVVVFLV